MKPELHRLIVQLRTLRRLGRIEEYALITSGRTSLENVDLVDVSEYGEVTFAYVWGDILIDTVGTLARIRGGDKTTTTTSSFIPENLYAHYEYFRAFGPPRCGSPHGVDFQHACQAL